MLWTADEVRCLLVSYDENRVQLRLVRPFGTVKTDLFTSRLEALAVAQVWQQQCARQLEAIQEQGKAR